MLQRSDVAGSTNGNGLVGEGVWLWPSRYVGAGEPCLPGASRRVIIHLDLLHVVDAIGAGRGVVAGIGRVQYPGQAGQRLLCPTPCAGYRSGGYVSS